MSPTRRREEPNATAAATRPCTGRRCRSAGRMPLRVLLGRFAGRRAGTHGRVPHRTHLAFRAAGRTGGPGRPRAALERPPGVGGRARRLHHPRLRRVQAAAGLPRGVLGDRNAYRGRQHRAPAGRDRARHPQLEPGGHRRQGRRPAGPGGGGGGPPAGHGDGADRRERRLPVQPRRDDTGRRLPQRLRRHDGVSAQDPADHPDPGGQHPRPAAAVVGGQVQRAGQAGVEAGPVPDDARRPRLAERGSRRPAHRGARPGGRLQHRPGTGLRTVRALPVRRRRRLRLPLRERRAEHLGLVPPQREGPGATGRPAGSGGLPAAAVAPRSGPPMRTEADRMAA
ncbi:putative Spermidine synthase [Actinacidiphila bryophytorum]|uniref:Spermidine synthase n=1 Tax=Actinacidiphila bryophytorum TaxID=1436133 RepID=A0A9W4GZ56_9ACTN|nr:putative Spermidine synthase [Actinacidiphila bryophytorum]